MKTKDLNNNLIVHCLVEQSSGESKKQKSYTCMKMKIYFTFVDKADINTPKHTSLLQLSLPLNVTLFSSACPAWRSSVKNNTLQMRAPRTESPSISNYAGKSAYETRSIGNVLDFNGKLQLTVFKEGLLYLVSLQKKASVHSELPGHNHNAKSLLQMDSFRESTSLRPAVLFPGLNTNTGQRSKMN